jgi:dihydroorotate dehydrogenase electron transfer subunit
MGPLGRPFHIPADMELALLVGGGTGLASLLGLARHLRSLGKAVVAVIGARSDEAFPLSLRSPNGRPPKVEELEAIGARSFFVSEREDGLLVTQWVETNLDRLLGRSANVVCYSCGPWGMMQAMGAISRARFPCQASLEMRMACGLGVCRSCVVRVRGQGGQTLVRTVCDDGPVFDAQEVIWEHT